MWYIQQQEDNNKRAEIFRDTLKLFEESRVLSNAIKTSIANTEYYPEGINPELPKADKGGKITISGERTYQSAIRLMEEKPGKRAAILNFASAVNPGGGVVRGASAQEEALCRASTLYPVLNTEYLDRVYYNINSKLGDNIHNDGVIYTPDIIVCKSDEAFPERIPETEYRKLDVLTCAAPNLNTHLTKRYSGDNPFKGELTFEEQYNIHYKRCCHILNVAAANGIDILVLGAFGCGAFDNDPDAVAKAMTDACREYRQYFDIINFAIAIKKKRTANYIAFEKVING